MGRNGVDRYGEIANSDKCLLGEEVGLKYNQRSMAEEVLGEQEKKNRWLCKDTILIGMVKQVKQDFLFWKKTGERIRNTLYWNTPILWFFKKGSIEKSFRINSSQPVSEFIF